MSCNIAIINADVRTMAGDQGHQALAITGQKITALGGNEQVRDLCGTDTHIIDAKGGTVMPGFVESHLHLFFGAYSFKVLKLHDIEGTKPLTEAIRAFAAAHPDDTLLVAQGLNYNVFDGGKDADRHVLDQICKDRPLLLQSSDFHNGWANTIALTQAGVMQGRELGPGSRIELDGDGTATGVLTEPAAVSCIQALGAHGGRDVLGLEGREPAGVVTPEQREADKGLLRDGLAYCAQHGITTIINMDGNLYQAELLRALENDGSLTCRLELPYHFTPGEPDESFEIAETMRRELNSEMLWCNRVKFFMDGVLDMSTAYRVQDYPDLADYRSTPLHTPERFAEVATELDKRGFQIAVHAIGDGAVRTVLDGYGAAQQANGPQGNRHRVEHIEIIDPADVPRFAQLDAIASIMPPHVPGYGDFPFEPTLTLIGEDQWKDAYTCATLNDAGARVCFSSDWPIAELAPLHGMNLALNRAPWDDTRKDERLSFDETLAAYTVAGAYACHREELFGSLQIGFAADIVILDRAVTSETIAKTQVQITICNGSITYQR